MTTYLYARISNKSQRIDRQIRNLLAFAPEGKLIEEVYSGTTKDRPQFNKLIKQIKENDVLVCDSVSRFSRNAEEGIELYKDLFNRGVNLVFLKERHIDTEAYKEALKGIINVNCASGDSDTDSLVKEICNAINKFMINKASADIKKAFEQSQKEVDDLHERTREGIREARERGAVIGRQKGQVVITKKSISAKETIKKYSKDFDGTLNDTEVIKLADVSRKSYYKYKKELKEEDLI